VKAVKPTRAAQFKQIAATSSQFRESISARLCPMPERTEGWVIRGGTRLHVVEWHPPQPTRGPDLFLLHGLSSNALYWERLVNRLAPRRAVALDQRSHGGSDRPRSGYARDDLLQDAISAIGGAKTGESIVAGHSWGAAIALDLAAARPDLVSALVLIDGPMASMADLLTWEQVQEIMQPPLPRFASLQESIDDVKGWLMPGWADDLSEFAKARATPDGDGWTLTLTAPVRLEILRTLYEHRPEDLWPHVKVPVFAALASTEPPPRSWREHSLGQAQALCPQLEHRWYTSGHDIPLQCPGELARDLDSFFARHGLGA
jgi:pimeloyl-ACP methyl ester carboxylesterase